MRRVESVSIYQGREYHPRGELQSEFIFVLDCGLKCGRWIKPQFAKVRFQQFYQPRHALAGAIRRSLHILPQVRHIWQAGMVPGDGKGCWEKVRMVLRGLPEGECSPVDRVVCF